MDKRTIGLASAAICALLAWSGAPAAPQAWSPHEQQVAIGGASLTLFDVPGRPVMEGIPIHAPLTGAIAGTAGASFASGSPDGRWVAFIGADSRLYLTDVYTGKTKPMDDRAEGPAAWAPDSKTFAMVHVDASGGLVERTLYPSGGETVESRLPFRTLATGESIAWVANTDNVVLCGGDSPQTADLYLIEQGQVVRLTTTQDVLGFAVSLDGGQVMWARRSLNTHYIMLSLYEMTIQLRTIRKLDYPNVLAGVNPNPHQAPDAVASVVFAPDLRHFVFVTVGGPAAGPGGAALYVSDRSGSQVALVGVSNAPASSGGVKSPISSGKIAAPAATLPPGPSGGAKSPDSTNYTFPAFVPSFSNDSQKLAAVRVTGAKRFLLILDLATGTRQTAELPQVM